MKTRAVKACILALVAFVGATCAAEFAIARDPDPRSQVFTKDAVRPEPTIESISLAPTIRLVRQGSKLMQVVELTVKHSPSPQPLTATVTVGGKSRQVALHPDPPGDGKSELTVAEVTKPTVVEVSVGSGGNKQTAACEIRPQRHWRVYVQPSSHVDIGYTDLQERVIARHNENMSLALDLCKKHPGFKWNTEVAWVEDNYLSLAPAERKSEFIKHAEKGLIGCQAVYGNMLTGILSHEEIIRSLYFAHSMSKMYGIPFDIAMSSDVPTQVWTLPTVLAGSGIKYFSAGLNMSRGGSFDRLFDKSPFYWEGPDGSRVLAWLLRGYAYAYRLHLLSSADKAESHIEKFLQGYERDDYPYDAVLAFGGFSDNQPLDPRLASVADEWNRRYAYPKIILCRGPEFFNYIESKFRDKTPTIRGDGGAYWEDGAGSSALETALVRRAKEDLAAAEKLHSLTSCLGGAVYPKADINQAWKDAILYDEHTWGAWCSIDQPNSAQTIRQWRYKKAFADNASCRTAHIMEQGLDSLAKIVKLKEPSVVVFNPLSWPVSGTVRAETADGRQIEFWADDVPPVGYKAYALHKLPAGRTPLLTLGESSDVRQLNPKSEIRPAQAGSRQRRENPQSEIRNPKLENRFYRLEFDRTTGAIKSLYDKELKRELVDSTAPYGINQYIYIKGQGDGARDVTWSESAPAVTFAEESRPCASVMRIRGSAYNTPEWTTEVVLYGNCKRIDFENVINKQQTTEKEAGYFAFPFSLNKPQFYVGLPNGVMRPDKDMLDGACMQWYCAQDFVAIADDKGALVWTAVDSPLITLGDINRETFKSPLPIENGHLYAYVFNNYWYTNYKAVQGGELKFRFSLTSIPKYDPVAAARFGQSVRNPLLSRVCEPSGRPSTTSHEASASLCSVTPSNIVIQAVKKAESGDGLIIRLREISGKRTKATLRFPTSLREGWSCSLVEDPHTKLSASAGRVGLTVPANGLATILVR